MDIGPNQIISHSMGVMGCTRFQLQGTKYIMYKMRVVSLAHDMPTGPYLCLYQILSKYFKPFKSYEVHMNLA